MILLKTLQLNNFLSHEKTTIDFKDNSKLLLDGKSGSGKSSITEAILWALYGKGRSENRSLVRKGTKMASVVLRVVDGEKETNITRTVSNTGKNTLSITQNTGKKDQFIPIDKIGIKENQEWIEKEFLKASYELFTNSICYPQENENSFVKANAAKRKDLLLEIVQAGNFDDLYVKARNSITKIDLEKVVDESNLVTTEEVIRESKELINATKEHLKVFKESIFLIESFVEKEKELEKELNNISQVSHQISDKKQMERMLLKTINDIDLKISSIKEKIESHKKIDINKAKEDIKEIESLKTVEENTEKDIKDNISAQESINKHLTNRPNKINNSKEIEEINRRLEPLLGETTKCPAGDDCPFVKPIQGQIDFLKEQIASKTEEERLNQLALIKWENDMLKLPHVKDMVEIYNSLKDIRNRIIELSKSKEIIKEYELFEEELPKTYETLQKLEEEKLKYNKDVTSNYEETEKLEQILNSFDINKTNQKISEIRIQKAEIQKKLDDATYGLKMGESATIRLKEATAVKNRLKTSLHKAVEDKEALELLKEALSPRGIKAVVIDYLVPQLEDRINAVLGQMSDFKIRLDTQKATADDEGVKEGLFITVINDLMEELSFDNYSGGEKVKITVAISEALASLMNQIGFRVMDENIVSLDRESTEGFVDVLAKLQIKFPQLLIISHLQEVKDLFEKQILITKAGGISKINGKM